MTDQILDTASCEEARNEEFGASVDRSAASLSTRGVDARAVVDAVIDEVEEQVAKTCGEHPFAIEGREERTWILMDYGSVLVHVFTPDEREYYRLEKLWGDAPRLELDLD